jgi:hypothetical protein
MKPLYFFISLLIAFYALSWFGRHTVKTTLPRQVLCTYEPDTTPHVVFLGSSLTDAAVDRGALDSFFRSADFNFRAFNCALAEMSGDAYFYLIMKNRILARSRPAAIAVELRMFPFNDSKKDFTLTGRGIPADLTLSELMEYRDFMHVSGGFPGVLESIAFLLHKHWFLYHHRLNIQGKVVERIPFAEKHAPAAVNNPYGMRIDAGGVLSERAEDVLDRKKRCNASDSPVNRNGYFYDIVSLAKANNVQLIFFRPPFPQADAVLQGNPEYERNMALFQGLCDSLGIVNWDLSIAPQGTQWTYSDGIHLDHQSRQVFTREIGRKLQDYFSHKNPANQHSRE